MKVKKILSAILLLLVASCLTACNPPVSGASDESPSIDNGNAVVEDDASLEEPGASASEEEARRLAFGKVLWDAYQRGILPDGHELEYTSMEDATDNSFAIIDVDGDGQDELLLFWENAITARMVGYVFGYDDGAIREELAEYPTLTFYNNGTVKADWSHNQGLAGEFWPYNVYRYDGENDVYRSFGGVDAWDKSVREINGEGDPFPTDIDTDGDGIVYNILPADWDGQYDMPLVDGAEYENWKNASFDDAEEIIIPRQKLTEENIASLGYPKPSVPLPQTQG